MTFPCCPYDAPCSEHEARPAARLQADPDLADQPIPYALTAKAEAMLDAAGPATAAVPGPEAGS